MANMIQNNFVGGEISPALYGRSDLQAYYRSCAKAENFVVSREGSLKKRRGIEAVGTINHPHGETKIVPYIYDRDEAGVVIIYREGGNVKAELRSKDALQTPGAPVVVYEGEIAANEIRAIRCSQIGDTLYTNSKGKFNKMLVINWANKTIKSQDYAQRKKPHPVSSITAKTSYNGSPDTFRTITYGAYIVRDGILSEVKSVNATFPTVWQAGANITVTVTHGQSLDNPNYDYILIGKKSGSFFGELARFYPEDVTRATVTFKDENHVPADMIYSQTNILGDGFHPPIVTSAFQQRLVFANGASMKWIPNTITMTTAATSYTITGGFIELISVKNGSTDVTSQCTVSGSTIAFPKSAKYTIRYYQKIDTTEYPMTLWFSSIGNLYSFYANRPAADDDPFSPTLMSTGPSFIRWLTPYQKAMIAFTDAGIFAIAGSATEGFSASTCQINKLSNLSVSQEIAPIETEAGLIFVAADNKTLYSMAYDIQTDATRPIHRMLMVKHLTRATHFTSIALQQFPDQVIWCGLSDGTFASFTFEKDEEVFAWSHHSCETMSILETVGTGTVTDSSIDHTFGDIIFAIEDGTNSFKLGKFRTDWKDVESAAEGIETPVKSELVTLPSEATDQTIAYRNKNVKDVLVRFFESGPLKVVPFESGLMPQVLNKGKTSFTGDAKVKPMGYISDRGQMHFISDTNTDSEILMIVSKMEVA